MGRSHLSRPSFFSWAVTSIWGVAFAGPDPEVGPRILHPSVRDISEEDKLFNFMTGLQPWAQIELRMQGVKDLLTGVAATNRLVNFRVMNDPDQGKDDTRNENAKFV
ncbi:UNVERIFIED_CONTAM: hypothetical protein Slati_3807500 [Sesamum latifolium]|uniref:Uncharacterized protein n=1 Tax=Sesamum latifolium TaxID=2727402 RepID=A0AAW2U5T6_9LAMI